MQQVIRLRRHTSTGSTSAIRWNAFPGEVVLCLAVTTLVFVVILWHNWIYITSDVAPYSDVAADMLLIERARHDWLLVGHYSRFGFNHPGPFFLYGRHLADLLFGHVLPGPYNAHLLAVIGLNAFFIGVAAATVAVLVASDVLSAMVAAVATVLVLFIQDQGIGILAHPWMPFQLVPPFFAFILLLAGTMRGHVWMLPVATLCGAILVHGYLPLVPFVALPWLLSLGSLVVRRRRSDPQGALFPLEPLLLSIAVIAAFMLPLVLDVSVNPPGNVIKLWNVTRAITPESGTPLNDVARFIGQFWTPAQPVYSDLSIFSVPPVLWITAALCIPIACWPSGTRAVVVQVAAVVALMTLLLALYVWRAPGPLYPYIAEFYLAAPLTIIVIVVAGAARVVMWWVPRLVVLLMALLGVVLVWKGSLTSPNQHMAGIRELSTGVVEHLGDRASSGVRIAFENHGTDWAFVTGLLLDLERMGVPTCVDAPDLAILFTSERVCARSTPGEPLVMVGRSACAGSCVAWSDSLQLGVALPPKIPAYLLGQLLTFAPGHDNGRPFRAGGWSIPDLDGVFSNAPEAELVLPVSLSIDGPLELRIKGWSFVAKQLPRQKIEVVVNGRQVTTWEFSTAAPIGERAAIIPMEVAKLREPLSIVFRMPDAASPLSLGLSADVRQLGIGLQWLKLDRARPAQRSARRSAG